MKKGIKTAVIILVLFLSFLWFEKPLRSFLIEKNLSTLTSDLSSGILIRTILIFVAFYLIRWLGLINFSGRPSWTINKNLQALLIPSLFIFMGLSSNWSIYGETKFSLLILFGLSTLVVGIVEEFFFRGIIFPLFIKDLKNSKRPIVMAAILSSLLFGMIHFVNVFQQPDNISGILSQVFFATSIGVFFCGLMVRTENILLPCIIHAMVNFSFGAGELIVETPDITNGEGLTGMNLSSLIPTAILFTFIFIGGVFMIVKSDKAHIYKKFSIVDKITTS